MRRIRKDNKSLGCYQTISIDKSLRNRLSSFLLRRKASPTPEKRKVQRSIEDTEREISELKSSLVYIDSKLNKIRQKENNLDISFGKNTPLGMNPASMQHPAELLNSPENASSLFFLVDKIQKKINELDLLSVALSKKQVELEQKEFCLQSQEQEIQDTLKKQEELEIANLSLQNELKILNIKKQQILTAEEELQTKIHKFAKEKEKESIEIHRFSSIQDNIKEASLELERKASELIEKENELNLREDELMETWNQINKRESTLRKREINIEFLYQQSYSQVARDVLDDLIANVSNGESEHPEIKENRLRKTEQDLDKKMKELIDLQKKHEIEFQLRQQELEEKSFELYKEEQRIREKKERYLKNWGNVISKFESIQSFEEESLSRISEEDERQLYDSLNDLKD